MDLRLRDVLRAARHELRCSQAEFANRVGYSRFTINQLETGRRSLTPEVALEISDLIPVSAEELLTIQLHEQLAAARAERARKAVD